jgi:hypothetical protein
VKAAKAAATNAPAPTRARARRGRSKRPRRIAGDWWEEIPSREHIPLEKRMADSIALSSKLSKLPIIGREEVEDVVRMVPSEINPILQAAGIEFVLAGAHGVSTWLAQPRATQDVDYIIREREARKAAEAILKKYPTMELEKHADVWRFKRGDEYVIDLILTRAALFKRVFTEFIESGSARQKFRVPKLEAALAMKFASMVGHYRRLTRAKQDAVDFMSMVEANSVIDVVLLRELGELVYSGGGDEVLGYVKDVRAGRNLKI